MQKSDISDHIRTYSSPLPMHFVQLLSSIFFLIREPLAIWMLMLLGSLYPIYIKRKNRIFLPLWMGMFKLPSQRRKRSEWNANFFLRFHILSCHSMSSWKYELHAIPVPPDCEFYISQWAWMPSDAETLPPWRVYEFVSDIYFSHHPSHFPLSLSGTLKKSGIFLYSLFFAHFREIF